LLESCDAVGLAGEASRNDVSQPFQLCAVEGTYIGPDWGVREIAVFDACLDDFLTVGFDFDISDNLRVDSG